MHPSVSKTHVAPVEAFKVLQLSLFAHLYKWKYSEHDLSVWVQADSSQWHLYLKSKGIFLLHKVSFSVSVLPSKDVIDEQLS